MNIQSKKMQQILKQCKPDHKVITKALDYRIEKLNKPIHSLIKRKKKMRKRQRHCDKLKKIQIKVLESHTDKLTHGELHNTLTFLAVYRKKLEAKYTDQKYAPTLMYLFIRYVHTAKGSEKLFLTKQLNKRFKAFKAKYHIK